MKIFFTIILFSFVIIGAASELTIDSLIISGSSKIDTSKVHTFWKLIKAASNDKTDLKLKFANRALEISNELGYTIGRAKSFEYLASIMYQDNKYIKGLEYNFRALDIYNQNNLGLETVNALVNIGLIFNHYGDVKAAKTYAKFASQKLYLNSNPLLLKETIINLIQLHLALNNLTEAKSIIDSYAHIFTEFDSHKILFAISQSNFYLAKKDIRNAKKYGYIAYQLASSHSESMAFINTIEHLGQMHLASGKLDSAFFYLNKSKIASRKTRHYELEAKANEQLANLFLKQKDLNKAMESALSFHKIATNLNNSESKKTAQLLFARINESKGNFIDAFQNLKNYLVLSDSLAAIQNSEILNSLVYKRGLAESEYLNEKLKNENIKKDQIIKDKQVLQVGMMIGTLIIFGFSISVVFLFIKYRINNKRLKAKTEEILQQNETLEIQNVLFEKLSNDKNGLIGVVSHDLKAPLNRIEGLLTLINSDGELNKEQHLYLSVAQRELKEAKEMIKKILDSELKNADETKLKIELVNVNQFLEEILENYQIIASNKSIEIHIDLGDENLEISTDKNYLSRIIDNLISNAIKFSESEKNIFVKLQPTKEGIEIRIQDEGPGFTDEDKKRMFKKYQKLSAQPTRGENSTGLGLHIVHLLTSDLQGTISLESVEGKGATFILNFKKEFTPSI